jgi:hypothetical protein
MATTILARHPLATLSSDSDLALVLELEDPVLMSPERLEEVLRLSAPGEVEPEVRAYLWGLYDQRRIAVYSGAPH